MTGSGAVSLAADMTTYALLGIALFLGVLLVLTPLIKRFNRGFTRIAVAVFGMYVAKAGRKKERRERLLRAAHFPTTYRMYASKTILYAVLSALIGGIVGMYLVWGVLRVFALQPSELRESLPEAFEFLADFAGIETLPPSQLAVLFIVSSLTLGAIAGLVVYTLRWWYVKSYASARERQIEATLPQVIAFMYALSRSGMEFPQVMRILSEHQRVYGAAAEEVQVAVRHMDVFGQDTISAVRTMSGRTSSEMFNEFAENLASVLQSGRNLEEFLERQYEEFQEEAENQQDQLLTQLATLAEVYVTVFVAGVLFTITILIIIGIAGAETLIPTQVLVYLGIPLGNLAFLLYLDSIMQGFGQAREVKKPEEVVSGLRDVERTAADSRIPDGGVTTESSDPQENAKRLMLYKRLQRVKEILGNPKEVLIESPEKILYATVPLAVLVTGVRIYTAGTLNPAVIDDYLVQAALFVIGTFAVVYEIHRRRIEAIEAVIPDFLARLANVNQAGMSIIDSIDRTRRSDLGALNPEIDRLWADIKWGSTIETGLQRLEYRVHTQTVSRVVALITNAMNASGNISRVLSIAAKQAREDRLLKRERKQEMLTYLVVIYIAFGVFLMIILAFEQVLLPSLPEEGLVPDTEDGQAPIPATGIVGQVGAADIDAFSLVFVHAALIQAIANGFIAGQMSRGDLRSGALHATILLALAYITLWAVDNLGVMQGIIG